MKKQILIVLVLGGLWGYIFGCDLVNEKECYEDSDCAAGMTCATGECILAGDSDENNNEPTDANDVPADDHDLLNCPEDMIGIDEQFCMDMYEASKSDATVDDKGGINTLGPSRKGVIPWFPVSYQTAKQACEAVGKRLCTEAEWSWVCQNGEDQTIYAYGDIYTADTCNGIDAFCEDPFPHCRGDDDFFFKVQPTGSFPECTSQYGPFDLNGNVWEWVDGDGEGNPQLRGGAYNCGDSERLHRCAYVAGDTVSAKGFRCCCDGD